MFTKLRKGASFQLCDTFVLVETTFRTLTGGCNLMFVVSEQLCCLWDWAVVWHKCSCWVNLSNIDNRFQPNVLCLWAVVWLICSCCVLLNASISCFACLCPSFHFMFGYTFVLAAFCSMLPFHVSLVLACDAPSFHFMFGYTIVLVAFRSMLPFHVSLVLACDEPTFHFMFGLSLPATHLQLQPFAIVWRICSCCGLPNASISCFACRCLWRT